MMIELAKNPLLRGLAHDFGLDRRSLARGWERTTSNTEEVVVVDVRLLKLRHTLGFFQTLQPWFDQGILRRLEVWRWIKSLDDSIEEQIYQYRLNRWAESILKYRV